MDEEERDRIRRETVEKWVALGFLDGLDNNNEVTTGGFENVVFPIIRRVYARLLSSEIEPFTPDLNKLDFKPYNRIKKHKL